MIGGAQKKKRDDMAERTEIEPGTGDITLVTGTGVSNAGGQVGR